jgi:hypothetical protein
MDLNYRSKFVAVLTHNCIKMFLAQTKYKEGERKAKAILTPKTGW